MAERRESVRLELVDGGFSTGMVKAAASTGLLERALKSLDGTNVVVHERISESATSVDGLSKSSRNADRSINQLTGRLRLFADAAAILGPSLVPLGGVAVAGIAGLASQMGFAAIAGGVLIGSMQGLGDALSALNDAHLEPTAENMAKAEDALNQLTPAAADFAREAYGLLPVLRDIRDAGAEGLFPGLTDSLDDLERLAPVVSNIFSQVGSALGDIASGGAASLASDRWINFFQFIADEAPRALSELAATIGSLTHGLAELWMAFAPLNRDVSGWLVDVADGFDRWASGLSETEGFREFVEYIRTNGPLVADALGSLANAVIQIVQAAAPLGGPTLVAITAISNALAAIADSKIGTGLLAVAAGMAAVSRAAALMKSASALSLASFNPLMLAVGAGVTVLTAWTMEAQRAAAETAAFGETIAAMDTAAIVQGLEDAQQILLALDGGIGSEVVAERIRQLEDEVAAREKAAEASRRAAADDAYYNSIQAETAALEKNIGMMRAKRDEALRSFSAQTNYSQSLLDSKNALEENGKAWNLNTEAGLANRRVVEQQAASWNELNRTQGQTPEQARKARQALVDTAMSLGATREEARRYANQLMDIPNDLKTKIGLDVDTAMQRARAIKAELASIDRNIDVDVNVRRPNAGGLGPQIGGSADGGTVPKTGKPYADRHHYLLADGEEVISNRFGQADRHRDLLKAINAGRLADGGTTSKGGKRKAAGGLFVVDRTDALEEAIRRLTDAQEHQTEATERDIATRDEWAAKMADVAQGTISGFNTGLFDKASNPWAASSGGPLGNLGADIAGLEARGALQAQLAAAGLSGDALAAVLSEGSNAQLQTILSSGTAAQVNAAFNQRAALQGSVGGAAGQLAFGADFAAASAAANASLAVQQQMEIQLAGLNGQVARNTAALERMERTGPERTGDAVGDAINGAASKAHRDRKRGR